MFWPFTVCGFLKPNFKPHEYWISRTCCCNSAYRLRYWNFTNRFGDVAVLAACCNSAYRLRYWNGDDDYSWWSSISRLVATVLTVYGIETSSNYKSICSWRRLQQCLPFTVLKPINKDLTLFISLFRCNSAYRLRYWNQRKKVIFVEISCCNSAYRLRYWNEWWS